MKRCATRAFIAGVDIWRLSKAGIPDFGELNTKLARRTGWEVVAVPGLVPDPIFYSHLSARRFPAGNFIRTKAEIDYIAEPDVFHDVFGHIPLLTEPRFATIMQKLGELGMQAIAAGKVPLMARLYWHVVEFSLLRQGEELKVLGAGLASSFSEAQ